MVDQHRHGDPDPPGPWWFEWNPLWFALTPPGVVLTAIALMWWLQ